MYTLTILHFFFVFDNFEWAPYCCTTWIRRWLTRYLGSWHLEYRILNVRNLGPALSRKKWHLEATFESTGLNQYRYSVVDTILNSIMEGLITKMGDHPSTRVPAKVPVTHMHTGMPDKSTGHYRSPVWVTGTFAGTKFSTSYRTRAGATAAACWCTL